MIKNIVFDVGNVLVKWSPREIIIACFGENCDINHLQQELFANENWIALNKGHITIAKAKQLLSRHLNVGIEVLDTFFDLVKSTQTPILPTHDLLPELKAEGYQLYALTDNVKENMLHLKKTYNIWHFFNGIVVSAEVQMLKPDPKIYLHLLETYDLRPEETLFIDDMPANVRGAKAVGMHSLQFTNAQESIPQLRAMISQGNP